MLQSELYLASTMGNRKFRTKWFHHVLCRFLLKCIFWIARATCKCTVSKRLFKQLLTEQSKILLFLSPFPPYYLIYSKPVIRDFYFALTFEVCHQKITANKRMKCRIAPCWMSPDAAAVSWDTHRQEYQPGVLSCDLFHCAHKYRTWP